MNKNFYAFLLLFTFFAIAFGSMVRAQEGGGVVVSPKRVVFGPGDRILEVLIANRGDTEQKFRISLVNRAMGEDGQLKETQTPAEGEFFASDVLQYSPRQVVLPPRGTQKVRLMSRLRANSPDGEYRSHLLIQQVKDAGAATSAKKPEESNGLGINITAIFGMSLPVILRKGNLEAEAALKNPEIVKVGEDSFVKIMVERKGTKSFMGTVNVYSGSQKIGTLKNVAVYLSNTHRTVMVKIGAEFASELSGKPLRVTYAPEEQNEDAPDAETTFTPGN